MRHCWRLTHNHGVTRNGLVIVKRYTDKDTNSSVSR